MTERNRPIENTYFEFDLPRSWDELDLKPATRDRSMKLLVDERMRDIPEFRPHRAAFVRYLRTVTEQAWDSGARYCAAFCEPAGEGIITGSLTVTVLPAPTSGSGTDDIVEQLQQGKLDTVEGTWSSLTHIELASGVEGARQFGVRELQIDSRGTPVRHVFMYTFLPFEGSVFLVACASPAADLADPLFELFGHISDSFGLRTLEPNEQ